MILSIIGIVVLLSAVVFFHELGHYSVAKAFGIRVEVFSLGFGKKIFERKIGETQYCLSLLPFGGYVKLFGDDPNVEIAPAERRRAFLHQALYKRFLVVFAGPASNLILALVIYALLFFIGVPVPSNLIGGVTPQTAAWVSGLRDHDRILKLNDDSVSNWEEIHNIFEELVGNPVTLTIDRDGKKLKLSAPVSQVRYKNLYGKDDWHPSIEGLSVVPVASGVGISDPQSPAAKAGFRTGDLITKVGTRAVETSFELGRALAEAARKGPKVTVQYKRPEVKKNFADTSEKTLQFTFPSKILDADAPLLSRLGFEPTPVFLKEISPDSPGEKAGLRPGDRLLSLDGQAIYDFDAVLDVVARAGRDARALAIRIRRDGKEMEFAVRPLEKRMEHPLTHAVVTRYLVGMSSAAMFSEEEKVELHIRRPVPLVLRAVKECQYIVKEMMIGLSKMVTGEISLKAVGGPVQIATIAGNGLRAGWAPFFQVIALISLNLFLLNLLPIPVLDGGHLFFYVIEGIIRRPVPLKAMEFATRVGLILLMSLLCLSLYNDVVRLITPS